MKSYAERAKEGGNDEAQSIPQPCGFCGEMTKHETLRMFGARCGRCYQAFCSYIPSGPDVGDKRTGDDKSWAKALQRREEGGERLSSVQRAMWREALGLGRKLKMKPRKAVDVDAAKAEAQRKVEAYLGGNR